MADEPAKTNNEETTGKSLWERLGEDKRLLGAGAAGLLGGTVGALVAPDFIYKKPTWYNRLLLGAGTGLSSAAIVLAAIAALENKNEPGLKQKVGDVWEQTKANFSGERPGADVVRQMTETGRSLYGHYGTGLKGWFVRNFLKRPFGSYKNMFGDDSEKDDSDGGWGKTLAALGIPLFTGTQATRFLNNRGRANELIRRATYSDTFLSPRAKYLIDQLNLSLTGRRSRLGHTGEFGKALVASSAQKLGEVLQRLGTSKIKLGDKAQYTILRGGKLAGFGKWLKRWGRNQGVFNNFLVRPGERYFAGSPTRGIFEMFAHNPKSMFLAGGKQVEDLVKAHGFNRNAFRGAPFSKTTGVLTALITLGLMGGLNSLNSQNSYQKYLDQVRSQL